MASGLRKRLTGEPASTDVRALRTLIPLPLRMLGARLLPLPSRLSSPHVSDVTSHVIRAGIRIDVYWLRLPTHSGPAASLLIFKDEVMRFDCVGPNLGHMHLNMKQTRGYRGDIARLYFHEQDIVAQIERSCFELRTNLAYALKTNFSEQIRQLQLEPSEIEQAAAFLRCEMKDRLARHRSDLSSSSADTPTMT